MPGFDKCHEQVIRALQNDGWNIAEQQVPMKLDRRRVFIDLLATHGVNGSRQRVALIEVKCFQIHKIPPMKFIQRLGSTFFTVLC